jgi:hypothetical protein
MSGPRLAPFLVRHRHRFAENGRTGCFYWTGARGKDGYVRMTVRGRRKGVHVHAWESVYGRVPPRLVVAHLCGDRSCVEMEHLALLTRGQVSYLISLRGQVKGSLNGRAKLTEAEVYAIRDRFKAGGTSILMLARAFGSKPSTVRNVVEGRTWRHLK